MRFFVLLVLLLFPCVFVPAVRADISPSQVLVLYNADWRDDHPLTDPGQDSLEIAEHYVRLHSDPTTGEKPYLLGLHCDHGIKILDEYHHLNQPHLEEESADNTSGVIYTGKRWFSDDIKDDQLRDSRLVEFILPNGRAGWKIETLQMSIVPDKGENIPVVKDGAILDRGRVAGNNSDAWTIRLNAKSFVSGSLRVDASCRDLQGEVHSWQADYVDSDQVELSPTGRDGIADDKNVREDVDQPLKAFLEDPRNARPDGALLKDHILFIVVCYGLPRTVIAPAGIARGITDQIGNFGSIIDFGQRLQLLYYNLENVQKGSPKPYKYATKGAFSDFFLRSPQAWPLYGSHANPFVCLQAYNKSFKPEIFKAPPLFSASNRNRQADKFLYFVSRIDAPSPLQARALIDRAVYASRHAGPGLGKLPRRDYPLNQERTGAVARSPAGSRLWQQGWHHLYHGGQGKDRLEFLRLGAGEGFLNPEPVYLPGGIAGTVISHNGWKKHEMIQQLAAGVTATAGAAKVYRGAPHIHSKSWWDDSVLYPALVSGRTLGEAWLMNQLHLGWITTFVGDPLMTLPAVPREPKFQLDLDSAVVVKQLKNEEGENEVWLRLDLESSAKNPQVAQLKAVSEAGTQIICSTFEGRPHVRLGDDSVCNQHWTMTIMDPYGETITKKIKIDCHQ